MYKPFSSQVRSMKVVGLACIGILVTLDSLNQWSNWGSCQAEMT